MRMTSTIGSMVGGAGSVTVVVGYTLSNVVILMTGVVGRVVAMMVVGPSVVVVLAATDLFVAGGQRTGQRIGKVRVTLCVLSAVLEGDVALTRQHHRQPHANRGDQASEGGIALPAQKGLSVGLLSESSTVLSTDKKPIGS